MGNCAFEHLNSINLKHYNQTCSNDHLCKTTNAESAQANSHPIVTVQGNHPPNTTSNYFFCLQNGKKTCLKQQLQNLIQRRNVKKKQEQHLKNKLLSDYIYSIVNS